MAKDRRIVEERRAGAMMRAFGLASAVVALSAAPDAQAATVDVCATCTLVTIEAGIEAAGPGGTVRVHPGRYRETLTLTDDITIRGVEGSLATTWVGAGRNIVAIGGGASVTVEGFTMRPWSGGSSQVDDTVVTEADSRAFTVAASSLDLLDITIARHTSGLDGVGIMATASDISVAGSRFEQLAGNEGSGIYASQSTVRVSDSVFHDNRATKGAGLYIEEGRAELDHAVLTSNQATSHGGALYGSGTDLVLDACELGDNSAEFGGSLALAGSPSVVRYSRFANGVARRGAGVWEQGTQSLYLHDQFDDNVASGTGGALHIEAGSSDQLVVQRSVFRGNTSATSGGAIHTTGGGARDLKLESSHFWDNEAATGGGAIAWSGFERVALTDSTLFRNQTIAGNGGAMSGRGGDLEVGGSWMCANAAIAGGHLYQAAEGHAVDIDRTAIIDSDAGSGGGLFLNDADLSLTHSTLLGNAAESQGDSARLLSGSLSIEYNLVGPTVGNGTFFTNGSLSSATSDHNFWWSSLDQAYGGSVQNSVVIGAHEFEGDPMVPGYTAGAACETMRFEPAPESTAVAADVGVTLGEDPGFIDTDGDGVIPPLDCNDNDASVFPGARETCNNVDDDCDGLVDENDADTPPIGASTLYRDTDRDGFGAAPAVVSCHVPVLYTRVGGDCNDAAAGIAPDADEIWYDDIDQNCDGNDDDQDGDGFPLADDSGNPVDCDDTDARIFPGAEEVWYDGVDQDCDGANDFDQDGDGISITDFVPDCDDTDPGVFPGADEIWYDGIDQDCFGGDDFDQDGDGERGQDFGPDCNDTDPTINTGADELWYDGVDQDCDGNDDDQDGDGASIDVDCNDTDPTIYPGAPEVPDDGIDQDCSGFDFVDLDDDGFADDRFGGDDCDDDDPASFPNAPETPYDGTDQDCDGTDLTDVDGDGADAEQVGGPDCNDADAGIGPESVDIPYDGVDQDCDGTDLTDVDADGFDAEAVGGTDCNDEDDTVRPDGIDIPNDGIDQDCDGEDARDADNDGYGDPSQGGSDCNDNDATIHPGAVEIPYDGVDQDCDRADLTDVDEDGFDAEAAGGTDCDDTNRRIFPGAEEVWYDDVDQNCDGASDWDQDHDAFDAPEDCDDTDPAVNPGAVEVVNGGVDANCDGHMPTSRIRGGGCDALGSGAPWSVGLLAGMLTMLRRRRR